MNTTVTLPRFATRRQQAVDLISRPGTNPFPTRLTINNPTGANTTYSFIDQLVSCNPNLTEIVYIPEQPHYPGRNSHSDNRVLRYLADATQRHRPTARILTEHRNTQRKTTA